MIRRVSLSLIRSPRGCTARSPTASTTAFCSAAMGTTIPSAAAARSGAMAATALLAAPSTVSGHIDSLTFSVGVRHALGATQGPRVRDCRRLTDATRLHQPYGPGGE